ncbi:unnamed protein product, partial [Ixodes hexagonus]
RFAKIRSAHARYLGAPDARVREYVGRDDKLAKRVTAPRFCCRAPRDADELCGLWLPELAPARKQETLFSIPFEETVPSSKSGLDPSSEASAPIRRNQGLGAK